jgi:hypothetical protein
VGHTKDVLSVAFSADNRQIVSAARDHTIKLWNTLGVCKYTIQVRVKLIHQFVSIYHMVGQLLYACKADELQDDHGSHGKPMISYLLWGVSGGGGDPVMVGILHTYIQATLH